MRLLACAVTDQPTPQLRECIAQVLTACPGAQFFVVNNGRDPNEFASELSTPHPVTFAHVPVNLGHPIGVNCGMHYAASQGFDYFLLLGDNITLLTKDWPEKCLEVMNFDSRVGLIGGKVLNPRLKTVQWGYTRLSPQGLNFSQGQPREKKELNRIYRACMVAGCFLFIRVEHMRQVGYFDILFSPAEHGDADYAFRMWLAGYCCVYDGRIEVVHHGYSAKDASLRKLHTKAHLQVLDIKYNGYKKVGQMIEQKIDELGREIVLHQTPGRNP